MQELDFNYWMFLAGLGMFLFGMYNLEHGLNGLVGNSFKHMLQTFTNKSWKGILTGASITAILQSSSLVTLLVSAFLGGGIISLQNSLGVVFGANLGTTLTGWLVATLGFKLNISDLSFPFLAIGTFSYLFMDSRPILKNWGSFFMGFGLLFLGLDFMKLAIEDVAKAIDLGYLSQFGLWVFLVAGVVITALIQSSSAMLVIVLSALHSQIIDVNHALAMVVGANIGTTSTLVLASVKGTVNKKRLALANVIFNVISGSIVFLFIPQLVKWVYETIALTDPLLELVLLNTILNLFGIILFYPFLNPLGKFLNTRFKKTGPEGLSKYIKFVNAEVPEVAIHALTKENVHVKSLAFQFIKSALRIGVKRKAEKSWLSIFEAEINLVDQYNQLKLIEDEVVAFCRHLQEENLSEAEAAQIGKLLIQMRALIYAAKSIKDIMPNLKQIDENEDALANVVLQKLQDFMVQKMSEIESLLQVNTHRAEPIVGINWQTDCESFYNQTIHYLYANTNKEGAQQVPVSTLANAIRKTVSCVEQLVSITTSN
jgi:phosphate:Na+ symporter